MRAYYKFPGKSTNSELIQVKLNGLIHIKNHLSLYPALNKYSANILYYLFCLIGDLKYSIFLLKLFFFFCKSYLFPIT